MLSPADVLTIATDEQTEYARKDGRQRLADVAEFTIRSDRGWER